MVTESSSHTHALTGVRVLVTRPRDQAEPLARLIEGQGGEAIRFPTIEISELQDIHKLLSIIDRLDQFNIAIFISPNAVDRAMRLVRARRGGLPPHLSVACVGGGSARELKRYEIENVLAPLQRFDSETLLELPALHQVMGSKIVIFRGAGGRELLGDTLTQRGALVEYAECYRRTRPDVDVAPLLRRWARGEIDIVSLSSVDGLRNLFDMVGKSGQPYLLRTPVVVISERMALACREWGFETAALIASTAGDEAVLEAIKTWRVSQNCP